MAHGRGALLNCSLVPHSSVDILRMNQPLQKIIANRYSGRDIPIALVLPDGDRVPLSETPEVDVYARTWQGLKTLASPEMGALARAYVRNDIDFSGGARRVLGIAESLVGSVTYRRDRFADRARTWLSRRRGNRANIQHHYDVSNAFYRLWLDERMVYSCAYFRSETDSLDQAQVQKLDHICRKLMLNPGEEFLDIGCGWGALIFRAAQSYGVNALGITLSQNQYDYVKAKIAELGLGDRVRVQLLDYLDLPEDRLFDKIASIGMFEHVGVANYPRYFGKIRRILKPGGLVLNHGITHKQNQYDYVKAKIAELGLGDRVRVQLLDYLDLPEDRLFDKIASIGMFEHVGVANYPRYFGKIRRILKPGGLVLNHGITHNWPGGDSLGSGIGDFIEEYVFPGGQVAHVSRVIEGLAADGLELVDAEALREHYARTLWNWLDRLEANADAARREVGEEKFRVWRIYLAGSAHAFDRGWLSIFQLLVGKPLPDGRLPHPPTREYMYRS
ncbi:MAG: methyltransferase domain-containing protein [Betaproteobacteria bacterium]|nr:MAG: methyltransferase domain-containing protein [Betaproteobacteria bacterium]